LNSFVFDAVRGLECDLRFPSWPVEVMPAKNYTEGIDRLSPLKQFSPEVRRVLRVDLVVTLLLTGFASLTGPFTGLMLRTELGATPLQLSVMASAGAAFMLSSLLWARLVEGRRPLPYVVWAGFIGRGLFLLVPFVDTAWQMVTILVLANVLGTMAAPAAMMLVAQIYPRDERGRALGVVRSVGAVPAIIVLLGSGTLIGAISYRWAFVAAAVLGMAASLQQLRLPVPDVPAAPPARPSGVSAAWTALRDDRAFRALMIAACVFGTGIWIQMPAHPVLMGDVLKIGAAQAGMFAAVAAVAAFVGNGVWGRLTDRWGARRVLAIVYFIGALTPMVDMFVTNPRVLVISYVCDALMTTGLDLVLMLAIIDIAGRQQTARYVAIASTLGGLRGIVAPLAGAAIIEYAGVRAVYAVAATMMVAGGLVVLWQLRTGAATAQPPEHAPAPAAVRMTFRDPRVQRASA
jgi:MFS family permease